MVRNYKRKTRENYFPESLVKAVQKVKNKEMTIAKATLVYGIPRATLSGRIRGIRGIKSQTRGRPTVFTISFERNMAEVLHSMERCGFGLRKKEVTALVSHYATRNNITTPFKNNIPGNDWLYAFTKRHNLTLGKFQPDNTRKIDPFVIYGFFELLQNAVCRLDIQPNRIYYLSENIFNLDPTKETIDIRPFYSKNTSADEEDENITVLLSANACGDKIPPLIIPKKIVLWNHWLYGKHESQKSRVNPRVFENYFENIVFPKLCTNKDPLLIIYDGRSTHLDIHVLKMAAKNNLTVIKLPPYVLQLHPLDADVKYGIKHNLWKHLMCWKHDNVGEIGDDEISNLITQAWEQMVPNIISEGFKRAGIWPVDPDLFPREVFDQTALTEWEEYARNEDRVLKEPFLVKEEIESEDETIERVNIEINHDKVDSNDDKDDEISIGTDNEISNGIDNNDIFYEFKPSVSESCYIEMKKTPNVDNKTRCIGQNESVDHSDPLSVGTPSAGFADLTKAINNLCGELVSVRKEMSSFKKEFAKMTSTMAEFNKRIANVERKLPS